MPPSGTTHGIRGFCISSKRYDRCWQIHPEAACCPAAVNCAAAASRAASCHCETVDFGWFATSPMERAKIASLRIDFRKDTSRTIAAYKPFGCQPMTSNRASGLPMPYGHTPHIPNASGGLSRGPPVPDTERGVHSGSTPESRSGNRLVTASGGAVQMQLRRDWRTVFLARRRLCISGIRLSQRHLPISRKIRIRHGGVWAAARCRPHFRQVTSSRKAFSQRVPCECREPAHSRG